MEYFISCRERIWEESQVLHQNYIFLKLKRRINVHYHPGISRATPPIHLTALQNRARLSIGSANDSLGTKTNFQQLCQPYFPSSQYFIQDGHRLHFMQYANARFFFRRFESTSFASNNIWIKLTKYSCFLIDYFSVQPLLFCILQTTVDIKRHQSLVN